MLIDGVPYGSDGLLLTADQIRAASARDSNVLGGSIKLICFVPGRGFEQFQAGVAKRVPGKQFLQWSLHYNVTDQLETDDSRIGIWIARS